MNSRIEEADTPAVHEPVRGSQSNLAGWPPAVAITLFAACSAAVDFSPQPPSARMIRLSEDSNLTTVTVARETLVEIVLHSTYWQMKGSTNEAVIAPLKPAVARADLRQCAPGAGCGTVTQTFVAMAPAVADIVAERVVCGETMACRPEQRRFAVTVVVTER